MPDMPLTGGCRCDRLRFEVTAPPLLSSACHCRGCQRMTAGPYSLTIAVPAGALRVTAGEPVLGGCQGKDAHHWHCAFCKSWVYTEAPVMPDIVNVRTTMLDDPAPFPPFAEFQTAEKLPFAATGAVRSYPRWPDMADWPALTTAYQAR